MTEEKKPNLEEIKELMNRLSDLIEEAEEDRDDDKEWMTEEQKDQKHKAEWNDFEWEQRKKKLEREGPIRIWLTKDVDEYMNDSIVKKIREAADFPERDIELYISTFGGSVYAAISICDAILAAPNHVKTIGIGKIMSAGGPILVCGDERVMTENSFLMIHDIWSMTFGSPSKMESDIEHVKELRKTLNKYFSRFSDLEEEFFENLEDKKSDSFFSAHEALEMGIIDLVEEQNLPEE